MFLGLDLGTGSIKALVLDKEGAVRGEGSASYQVDAPSLGWAESDPWGWWTAAGKAVRTATDKQGVEIEALGLSGQMHGVVLTGDTGGPVRPAVTWADTRSREQLEAYERLDDNLRRRLGNPPWVGMAGPTLLWLRDNEPESYRSARLAREAQGLAQATADR